MRYPFDPLFLVCCGPRCNNEDRGDERGEKIREELKDLNKKEGRKASVRICGVSCLDLCDHGPNMIVQPAGIVYSHLTRESAKEVYHGEMGDALRRDDKQLDESEFRAGGSKAAKAAKRPVVSAES